MVLLTVCVCVCARDGAVALCIKEKFLHWSAVDVCSGVRWVNSIVYREKRSKCCDFLTNGLHQSSPQAVADPGIRFFSTGRPMRINLRLGSEGKQIIRR